MSDHSPGPNEVRMKDGTIAPRVLWEDLGVRRRKWAELRKLIVQRDTLLAALKAVEWVPSGRTYVDNEAPIMVCAWQCGNRRHMGHAPGCRRQAAIAAVVGE